MESWDPTVRRIERATRWVGHILLGTTLLGVACALCMLLRDGFSHVSDDDFARTVIAEEWCAAVRGLPLAESTDPFRTSRWTRIVDPSGTSWLPAPFWLTGAVMVAFGRSIAVARAAQLALLALSGALLLRTLRRGGLSSMHCAPIVLLGFTPMMLWMSASQSPDAWVAVLIASGAFALLRPQGTLDERGSIDLAPALGLLVATLSRYEAWPVALVVAAAQARHRPRWRTLVPLAGPCVWMLWNQLAHGAALHFFARVARYRQAHEAVSLTSRLLHVPTATLALLSRTLLIAMLVALVLILMSATLRRTWWPTLVAGLALWSFLLLGSLGDGAPTHHPERAQLALGWLGAAVLVVGTKELFLRVHLRAGTKGGAILAAALVFAGILAAPAHLAQWRQWPGQGDADRAAQIRAGLHARETDTAEGRREVSTCGYDYLAFIAAYGAPERVDRTPCR